MPGGELSLDGAPPSPGPAKSPPSDSSPPRQRQSLRHTTTLRPDNGKVSATRQLSATTTTTLRHTTAALRDNGGSPRRHGGGEKWRDWRCAVPAGRIWPEANDGGSLAELSCLEVCAGAGGQSLGLEQAGFRHEAALELDPSACATLRANRGSDWKIVEDDIRNLDGRAFANIDLISGGVPCPPFSIAGKQLGSDDDRDLFPQALRLIGEASPRAALLENVRGLAAARFASYRGQVLERLDQLGYVTWWNLVHASEHGVPQLRPRFVLVAIKEPWAHQFRWPTPAPHPPPSVGARGWPGADRWRQRAAGIAPTIVGGSKKHGGPDLGPTRARAAWKLLGVDGLGIANEPPGPDFPLNQLLKLTSRMVARIQGFPDSWVFSGKKTAAYRQIGNAFPPPVAAALGESIRAALQSC